METFELGLYFALERFHQRFFFAAEDGLLHGADGELRPVGDFLGESSDGGFELVGGEEVVNDAETMRRLRVNHFAEVEHFRGNGGADELREEVSPAIVGEEADLGKILAEDGARGRPVDGGDDGLRHGANIQDSLHAGAKYGGEFGGIAALAALADGAKIAAGTEGSARAGEHDDMDGRITGDPDEGVV